MVNEIILFAGFGMIGGILRFLIGILKNYQTDRKMNKKMISLYFISLLIMGAFSGIVLGLGKILSFLGGYAAVDLMDGYHRSFIKKKIRVRWL